VLLGRTEPRAQIISVDPDSEVLAVAQCKARAAGVDAQWRTAMGDALEAAVGGGSASRRGLRAAK
jgi:predicted O-methyltransferase YrrM